MPGYPDSVIEQFQRRFGAPPALVVRAPGRINLIGEHTDYNEGFVLPAAIDKAIYFAASPRSDRQCRFFAYNFHEHFDCTLDALKKNATTHWADYLMGVIDEVQKAGFQISGLDLAFGGDIPTGSGLSSSAAVESGMARVLDVLFGLNLSKMDQVGLAKRAENNFVGLQCGIMDMFASVMGRPNACVKLDCRSLAFEYFPFESSEFTLVLCNSGVKHALVDSEYNTRRAECAEGVRLMSAVFPGINSLRDLSPEQILARKEHLPETVFRRCRYVTQENERVESACKALKNNDFQQFGQLMYQTHEGLQHDYEVSCPELDFLVEATRRDDAVPGSRMMGGGFGGCTINLVRKNDVQGFIQRMKIAYQEAFGRDLPCHEVVLSDGVSVISGHDK